MNLLDLPEDILVEILSYCKGDRTLIKATEVCKQFKQLIEETPRLMNQLQLRVETLYKDPSDRDARKFKRCLKSTRKYSSIDVFLDNEIFELLIEVKDKNCYLEKLLEKHAETAKEVAIKFASRRKDIDKIVRDYWTLLPNVERAAITLTYIDDRTYNANGHLHYFNRTLDSSGSDLDEEQLPRKKRKLSKKNSENAEDTENQTNFKLKQLDFRVEFPYSSRYYNGHFSSLDIFLSIVSPETLKSLSFVCNCGIAEEHYTKILQDLANEQLKLNLTSFKLHLFDFTCEEVVILLLNFLKSQQNLCDLIIEGNSCEEKFLCEEIPDVLESLGQLKSLEIDICNVYIRNVVQQPSKHWKLNNLEKLKVHMERCIDHTQRENMIDAEILSTGSEGLKELNLTGIWDFQFFGIANITIKFPKLVALKIDKDCTNYSSNDIFQIFKNLKELKLLTFKFPADELDEKLFDQYGDNLTLPKIAEVKFTFNNSDANQQIQKLMKPIKNAMKFTTNIWESCILEILVDIFIRELPKLIDLTMEKLDKTQKQKINEILEKLVQNPQNFKFNGKNIFDNASSSPENSDDERFDENISITESSLEDLEFSDEFSD